MTLDQLPAPTWVDDANSLQQLIQDLSTQTRIAVDTESNSLHAYREKVCLIQFSTTTADYLLDPLVLQDLSLLATTFSNPHMEKIFHAAEYDLICLKRDFGFEFKNIFDTMQAARILGCQFVGLEKLLLEKFDVKVDKRHQKADWAARPLTASQLDYARMDTHYLSGLRDILESDLRAKGRWGYAEDDFKLICDVNTPREKSNGATWKKFAARKDITARELTILSELCMCRDSIAESMNRPPFKVVSDDILLDIAKNLPEKDVDLAGAGLSQKQIHLWGGQILAATRRGVNAPIVKQEESKRPSDAMLKRLEKLKAWRKKLAEEMKVESDIILPKKFLSALAEQPIRDRDTLQAIMQDSPYRLEKYGDAIFSLIGGS